MAYGHVTTILGTIYVSDNTTYAEAKELIKPLVADYCGGEVGRRELPPPLFESSVSAADVVAAQGLGAAERRKANRLFLRDKTAESAARTLHSQVRHTLSPFPIQHTLSNTFSITLSSKPFDTPSQHTHSTHPLNTPNAHTRSLHPQQVATTRSRNSSMSAGSSQSRRSSVRSAIQSSLLSHSSRTPPTGSLPGSRQPSAAGGFLGSLEEGSVEFEGGSISTDTVLRAGEFLEDEEEEDPDYGETARPLRNYTEEFTLLRPNGEAIDPAMAKVR